MTKPNKDTHQLTNKKLSIQICLSGLSFCILDSQHTVTYLKHFSKHRNLNPLELLDYLKFIIDTETPLKETFNQVTVIYRNDLATVVPKDLFRENNLADYLKFNSKILHTDFVSYDELDTQPLVLVYVPLVNINNFIYDTFGAFTYKHFATVFIEQTLTYKTDNSTETMFVNVGENQFEVVVLNQGKLLLYNAFSYATKEDFIYYILFTAEQLKLNPESFKLIFTGNISRNDSLFEIAYKYIRFVDLCEVSHTLQFTTEIPEPHENMVLLNSF